MRVFNAALAVGFLVRLAWYSLPLIEIGWFVEIGALDLPDAVYRSPALVGGVLMIVFIFLRFFYRRPLEEKQEPGSCDKDPL